MRRLHRVATGDKRERFQQRVDRSVWGEKRIPHERCHHCRHQSRYQNERAAQLADTGPHVESSGKGETERVLSDDDYHGVGNRDAECAHHVAVTCQCGVVCASHEGADIADLAVRDAQDEPSH